MCSDQIEKLFVTGAVPAIANFIANNLHSLLDLGTITVVNHVVNVVEGTSEIDMLKGSVETGKYHAATRRKLPPQPDTQKVQTKICSIWRHKNVQSRDRINA